MTYPVMSTSVPWSLIKNGFKKTPRFNTSPQKPAAGRGRSAISYMPYPTWDFEVDLNYVLGGEAVAGSILQDFLGCYMACCGGGSPFLFTDPNDSAVTDPNQSFMLNVTPGASAPMGSKGDGSSTQFQLARQVGQGVDILQQVSKSLLYKYDWQGRKNLLTNSDTLVSTWTQEGSTVLTTANASVAPDSSNNAMKVSIPATSSSEAYLQQDSGIVPVNGEVYVLSVWLRADTPMPVNLRLVQNTGQNDDLITCNLTTQWQRFSLLVTITGAGTGTLLARLGLQPNMGAVTFYAWGAQLELNPPGNIASSYQKTGSNTFGPLFQSTVQRTNYCLYSQAFDNATWVKTNLNSVTADTIIAPDGTTTAEALTVAVGGSDSACGQAIGSASTFNNQPTTFSVWLKVPSGSKLINLVIFYNPGAVAVSQSVMVTTRWQRFTVATSMPGGLSSISVQIGGGLSFTSGTVHAWGAQLEIWSGANVTSGDYATPFPWAGKGAGIDGGSSYIPTTSTSASVIDYALGSTGVVTFANAPANGALLVWTGSFQYLCQFTDDTLKDLARVSKNSSGFLWSCGSIAFESVFV